MYYKVIPIPLYDLVSLTTRTVFPKYPYILVTGTDFRPVVQKCEDDEQLLCDSDNVASSIK